LQRTELSTEQMTSILSRKDTKLEQLWLNGNDLSSVDPAVLARAVNRLEVADLRDTKLSTEQMTSILSHVQEDAKLKKLWLQGNKAEDIEIGVVTNAREKLGNRLKID